MDLNFFIICFGVLAAYAAVRTVKRGWLRVLIVFCLVLCLIHVGFEQLFPEAKYQTAQAASDKRSVVSAFIADKLTALENDRCIMSHLEDTPLSPFAYMMEAHKFMRDYQAQAGAVAQMSVQQAASTLIGPQQADPNSLCDRLTQWVDSQAQAKVRQVIAPQAAPQVTAPPAAGEPQEEQDSDDQ